MSESEKSGRFAELVSELLGADLMKQTIERIFLGAGDEQQQAWSNAVLQEMERQLGKRLEDRDSNLRWPIHQVMSKEVHRLAELRLAELDLESKVAEYVKGNWERLIEAECHSILATALKEFGDVVRERFVELGREMQRKAHEERSKA